MASKTDAASRLDIQQLTEKFTARETEDKERIATLEAEIRRLKATESCIDDLQLKLLESKHILNAFQENETKLLEELRKQNRELQQSKASYNALVAHTQAKLRELQQYLQKVQEASQQEVSILKIKLARLQQTNQNLQEENKHLTTVAQQLLSKLERGDTSNLESIRAMLYSK